MRKCYLFLATVLMLQACSLNSRAGHDSKVVVVYKHPTEQALGETIYFKDGEP